MKKILIIEDEEVILNLLARKIEQEGFDVEVAGNGKEGLRIMNKTLPDLILLDIVMPEMDGIQVLGEMQKSSRLKKIPVIVISNSGQPVELERVKKLGAKDWLIKTEFNPEDVLEKIKKQLTN